MIIKELKEPTATFRLIGQYVKNMEKVKRITTGCKSRGKIGVEATQVTRITVDMLAMDGLREWYGEFSESGIATEEIGNLLGLMWSEVLELSLSMKTTTSRLVTWVGDSCKKGIKTMSPQTGRYHL